MAEEKTPERKILDDLSAFRDMRHFEDAIRLRENHQRAALGCCYEPGEDLVLADLLRRYRRALRHLTRDED